MNYKFKIHDKVIYEPFNAMGYIKEAYLVGPDCVYTVSFILKDGRQYATWYHIPEYTLIKVECRKSKSL